MRIATPVKTLKEKATTLTSNSCFLSPRPSASDEQIASQISEMLSTFGPESLKQIRQNPCLHGPTSAKVDAPGLPNYRFGHRKWQYMFPKVSRIENLKAMSNGQVLEQTFSNKNTPCKRVDLPPPPPLTAHCDCASRACPPTVFGCHCRHKATPVF